MSSTELEKIGYELEQIRLILERAIPPAALPTPLEKKLGKEAITYFDEDIAVEFEAERDRQLERGLIPDV